MGSGATRPAPGHDLRAGHDRSGFRIRSHTADVIVEAWGPTREACLAAAVRGLVATFADVTRATPRHDVTVTLAGDGSDLLVDLLEEVVFRLDVTGEVPVEVELRPTAGGVDANLGLAPSTAVAVTGAAPKGVAWSGLELASGDGVWRARATIDV